MLHTVSGRGRTARPYPVWASGVSVRACVSGCPDAYNRQLHPQEKTLAKLLADKSGGKYTQAQIEDQMRIMGVNVGGVYESGAASTLIGQLPTDSGAQWISGGTTADGKPILTQITAQPDPQLQSYILANYNSVSPGQVPSQFTYVPLGGGGSTNATGPFTKFDQSDVNYVRNTTADVASMVSTNAGRFSSANAAAAAIPSPYSPIFEAGAYVGTVVGFGADAVSQIARPDVGQYWTNSGSTMVSDRLSTKYPLASPVINEVANNINDSSFSKSMQDFINSSWNRITNQPAKK